MIHHSKFIRLTSMAPAVLVGLAIGLPATAQESTLVQLWQADWSLPDSFNSPGGPPLMGDVRADGTGSLNINAAVPSGSLSGDMTVSFSAADGSLRSGTNVSAAMLCCSAPNPYAWGDFNFRSYNVMFLQDQLTVAHNGFGFMTISVRTTGSMAHTANLGSAPYGYSDITLENSVRANMSIVDGESAEFNQSVTSQLAGISDGQFTANENQPVSEMMELVVPWENDLPVTLNFGYQEYFGMMVRGLDAERLDLTGTNSFGHTAQLFVNVYDDQGQQLDGVLSSTLGISYQTLSPVPEPASALLLAFGVLALLGLPRRGQV